jgi:hypothetical protein
MKQETQDFLRSLQGCDWFASVGQPIASGDVIQVASWKAAIDHSLNPETGENFLRARNELTMRIFQRSKKAYRSWGGWAAEVAPIIEGLVPAKLAEAMERSAELRIQLDDASGNYGLILPSITGNIGFLCMNIEYGHVAKSQYFTRLAGLYLSGHFPCGWEGTYPQGQMAAY